MKYDSWNVNNYDGEIYKKMLDAGISPLLASVLSHHGFDGPESALNFIDSYGSSLHDPMLLPDMDKAAARIKRAIAADELIAVYGDYDVDGITSTCLFADFLTALGARCEIYIPGRIEQGYGLNTGAISYLAGLGVSLIITVDCGITAIEEAEYAKSLSVDLVITDHHECRSELPDAVAVVDPHRKDSSYPFRQLAGVGVAFKLACAVAGEDFEQDLFDRYADFVCLGTVADVMPLLGENRILVRRGIEKLHNSKRPGIRALIKESGADGKSINVGTVGYILAPRINAAGRMEDVEIAVELLMSKDDESARALAVSLCEMNRDRRSIEANIYSEAVQMLAENPQEHIIVLASENWHPGVVGIVASRLSEEYRCPVALICIDGEKGKASSRSFGGFNLFESLELVSDTLYSYGGHALAAGFSIDIGLIDSFSRRIRELCKVYFENNPPSPSLELDCEITTLGLLSIDNVLDLDRLEPCGTGFPKPLFYMRGLLVESLTDVGGGRHLKMRLSKGGGSIGGIMFSVNAAMSGICEGDTIELAGCPQINEYRGNRSVQLLVTDLRLAEQTILDERMEWDLYDGFNGGGEPNSEHITRLMPDRNDFVAVWRYIKVGADSGGVFEDDIGCLARKISRSSVRDIGVGRLLICLDVFSEHGLIEYSVVKNNVHITINGGSQKVDLSDSKILSRLKIS